MPGRKPRLDFEPRHIAGRPEPLSQPRPRPGATGLSMGAGKCRWPEGKRAARPAHHHRRYADVAGGRARRAGDRATPDLADLAGRSEEHTSELQSLMRISY